MKTTSWRSGLRRAFSLLNNLVALQFVLRAERMRLFPSFITIVICEGRVHIVAHCYGNSTASTSKEKQVCTSSWQISISIYFLCRVNVSTLLVEATSVDLEPFSFSRSPESSLSESLELLPSLGSTLVFFLLVLVRFVRLKRKSVKCLFLAWKKC